MRENRQFYINGEWVDPVSPNSFDVINPATEEVCGHISMGSEADVDKAVAAAKAAFQTLVARVLRNGLNCWNRVSRSTRNIILILPMRFVKKWAHLTR